MTAYDRASEVAKNKASVFYRMATLWMAAKQYKKAEENIVKAINTTAKIKHRIRTTHFLISLISHLAQCVTNQLSLRQHQPARADPLDAVMKLTVHQNIKLTVEEL